eukprot:1106150-Pyramimonas_sp.AAC.1
MLASMRDYSVITYLGGSEPEIIANQNGSSSRTCIGHADWGGWELPSFSNRDAVSKSSMLLDRRHATQFPAAVEHVQRISGPSPSQSVYHHCH